MTHAFGTGGLSPLRLLGPVVCDAMSDSGFRAVVRRVDNVHLRTLAAGYPQDEEVLFWMWKPFHIGYCWFKMEDACLSGAEGYEHDAFRTICMVHPVS